MRSSKAFDHLWMPFTSWRDAIDYPPLVIESASGVYLYDREGKSYIDGTGSWWSSLFGHGHPVITAAVRKQLERMEHVMMAGCISEPTLHLIELLSLLLPEGTSRIFLSDDGSTAVEAALKMALQYHALNGKCDRTRFVSLGGGYHGDTLGAMSVGSIPHYHALFHHCFKKALFTDPPYCYRCPCGRESSTCAAQCMNSLEKLFDEHHSTIAAFIFEPMVQGAAGMRIYPSAVLERCFALCKKFGILTIADEVATGFGRTGTMFACEHAHVVPDIMCLAKGLTGGYLPLAVTAVSETIFDAFKGDAFSNRTFEHGHTFTGNPLASAAACASIDLMHEYRIPASLTTRSSQLAELLQGFYRYDIVGDVRTLGMVGAIELVADRSTKERLPAQKRIPFSVCRKALAKGLLIRPLGNVIYFMPPYITTEEQLERVVGLTHESLKETIDEKLPFS
ncbi:MAG: adenosylmethionine--8-amino-7-oxononanoate transaminase [Chitinispirillaceae bacterium]|nr:adenosylmethionine--8-amino-7-oxononanoate transaminase [Chitinispirillaceae bacterium]